MSLKLIELQVAIPRSMDASKMANDLSQKGFIQQSYVSEFNRKNQQEESKKVIKKQHTDQSAFHVNEPIERSALKTDNNKHPFKGLKIDYSG